MPANMTIFVPVPDKWTPDFVDTLYGMAQGFGFKAVTVPGKNNYLASAKKVAIGRMIAAIADGTLKVVKA